MTIVFSDVFTDPDGTALNAHTPDVNLFGGGWTHSNGAWTITSNKALASGSSPGGALWLATYESGLSDCIIAADIVFPNTTNTQGIAFRYTDNSNLFFAVCRGDGVAVNMQLFRREAGTNTQIGSASGTTITAGVTYTLSVELSGTSITVKLDGVTKITATSSFNQTATRHGFRAASVLTTFDNLSVDGTVPNSVILSSPTDYQSFQVNGSSQADIAISGTYLGTPAGIEARFNGGAWATLTSGGGTFSGTLSAQAMGQGTLEVRWTDDTSVTDSAAYVTLGDGFSILGQSNASGRGTNNQAYTPSPYKVPLLGNDYVWKDLVDPSDSNSGQIDTVSSDTGTGGSVWPLLADLIVQNTGRPVFFVVAAKGGTSALDWQPGADHEDRSTLYGSANYRSQISGIKCALWHQGEADALSGTSQATYNSRLDTVANTINSDLGVKLMPCKLHNLSGSYNETNVNLAIAEAWADNSNVLTGPDFSDITTSPDALHFTTNAELQEAADRWWEALQNAFYPTTDLIRLESTAVLYSPAVAGIIEGTRLESVGTVYAPTQVLSLVQSIRLESTAVIYSPSITYTGLIYVVRLESTAVVYAPVVSALIELIRLESTAVVYSPDAVTPIVSGEVSVTQDAVYAVDVSINSRYSVALEELPL